MQNNITFHYDVLNGLIKSAAFPEDQYVFFATAQGMVKKVQLSAFKNVRSQGMPLRLAVCGTAKTPSVDAVLALIGKEEVLKRIRS